MHKLLLSLIVCCSLIGCGQEAVLVPVAAGSWFNQDRRSAKTIIGDQSITVKANIAIAKNQPIWKASHISTLSYNNAILLVGQTKNNIYRQDIEKIVQKINGIGTIYNQITVGPSISLDKRACDTWITTKVKSRIINNNNVGINRVKVITEDSVVYLMGALTPDEYNAAINIARCVPGVKKVVTVFEQQADVVGPPNPIPKVATTNCTVDKKSAPIDHH